MPGARVCSTSSQLLTHASTADALHKALSGAHAGVWLLTMNFTGMPLKICSSSARCGPSPTNARRAPGTCSSSSSSETHSVA
jgi:hypothetical protein